MEPTSTNEAFEAVLTSIANLKPHPRNYRDHPRDQIEHIQQSIREHGFYRNVVVARDGTILAGHGVVKAATEMDIKEVPVVRLDLDPEDPRALKLLAGDNEISHLGEVDDRALTELLKQVKDLDPSGLLGTGFDEMMLANLTLITRPRSEIKDIDEAAHWVGLPGYEQNKERIVIMVHFETREERRRFLDLIGSTATDEAKAVWYPPRNERDDGVSIRFTDEAEGARDGEGAS